VEKICCELCDEKFFIPANLDSHVQRKHQSATENSEHRPLKCLFCCKLYKNKGTYKRHLKLFHKDEAIRCKYSQCFTVFRTEKSLEEHLTKEHFLNKPENSVKCKVCKIWVSSKNSLSKHIEKKHYFKSINCEFCPENYETKAKLFLHIQKSHKEVIKCRLNFCYLYFKTKQQMDDHFNNAHQIYCKFCDLIFTSIRVYFNHLRKFHLEKKCKFSWCVFYADSKEELENHLKEKHCSKFKNNLECVYCGKHFSESRGNMLTHVRRFHSKIAIQCDKKCARFFKSQDDLEKHKKEAHKKVERKKQTVECFYCQKEIWTIECYASHIKTHHLKEAIRCKHKNCCTFFKIEEDRKEHYEEKHVEKYNCAFCDYSNSQRINLKNHFERHHLPKDKQCPHCPKLFGSQQVLKEHIKNSHKPQENCPYCKKIRTNLNRHVVTTNCPACSQPFPCKKLYSDHKLKCKKVHTCGVCGKTFKYGCDLKYHINLRHKSGKMFKGYECRFCAASFMEWKSLKSHQSSEHFDLMKYNCEFCKKAFALRETFQNHIVAVHRIGGFECKFCDRRFVTKRLLSIHLQRKHVRPGWQIVECSDCGKVMKKSSLSTHYITKHF